jgi:predicted DNA-binding protein (MmcQ/YjbR family)
MDGRAVLEWCRARPGAAEELPFGPDTRVFKVGGRIFAILPADPDPDHVSLKCNPDFARHLRAAHRAIAPGYHLNKRHWNTVRLDGSLAPDLVEELLGHSYTLIVDALPRRVRDGLRAREALGRARELLERAHFRTGDFAAGEEALAEARTLADASGDVAVLAAVFDWQGTALHWRNQDLRRPDGTFGGDAAAIDEELALVERALAMRRELGDEAAIAESSFHVGLVHQLFTNRWDLAEERYREAHELAERAGGALLRSEVHRHLGIVCWHHGDNEGALRELRRSLELREEAGQEDWTASGLVGLGHASMAAGRLADAVDYLRRGVALMERLGQRPSRLDETRAALADAEARLAQAG